MEPTIEEKLRQALKEMTEWAEQWYGYFEQDHRIRSDPPDVEWDEALARAKRLVDSSFSAVSNSEGKEESTMSESEPKAGDTIINNPEKVEVNNPPPQPDPNPPTPPTNPSEGAKV